MNDIAKNVRLLSKDNYWQTLFSSSKEMSNIKLFRNDIDFTNLQVEFINYLSFYYSLNLDIYMGEVDKKIVGKSFMREDAYMYYKNKKENKPDEDDKESNVRDSWVFTRPKGK